MLALAAVLDECGDVPCRTSPDPDAWWPDRRDVDSPAARGAVETYLLRMPGDGRVPGLRGGRGQAGGTLGRHRAG